jgi:signal transduction histidine kinase
MEIWLWTYTWSNGEADDCLVKGTFSPELLLRAIQYAFDRGKVQLAQVRDSALKSPRLRAEFLAKISHEIRTPSASEILGR